ncbi:tyrosine--tRNA ligase [Lignipirellula cremea]|uniref:Tyrosine--tRNA ligase n=1 Tax=Lignipirellula cremea TaxID=2528010 RepID=A0A518DSH8_9BACT|nr:tyrosine--tRNA ligase [Lignipirellula cremea]QDU94789.1 Tyrosine--tRNA ligase [Lignipirellula cremea]
MNDLFADLQWRGLIHQTTDDANMAQWLASGSRTVYAGFDPTADSLHVGSLIPLLYLRRFQKAGHRPIALVGGATGMIGDPSGKSAERNLLSVEILEHNVASLQEQMHRFLDFEGDQSAVMVNNFDWMRNFSFLEFLRDIGKHAPVNVMRAKDSIKNRLESDAGISYTEFSYMLLQAYDFVHLHQQHGCDLQLGGSDQWGNITAGIDLARRMHSVQLYGMTCPLLTKKDGSKMGKTEEGTVWLSAEKTIPYKFYQYWVNVDDEDAGKCLRFLTELDHEEITALDESRASNPGERASQKRLAEEITRLVHGEQGLQGALKASQIFFGGEIEGLEDSSLGAIFADAPSQSLQRDLLSGEGLPLIDALVEAGLAKSKGDARRTIEQGGAYVNNRRQDRLDTRLTAEHLASETILVLRSGKKRYALLRFV